MRLTLRIWRQPSPDARGRMVSYEVAGVTPDMSFLETLDALNAELDDPVAFDDDCREGICGSCAMVVDGVAHGPEPFTTVCQLYMRSFRDGATIHVEPWRASAFPIVKDLVVDRSAFDRIVEAGAWISVPTGAPPDANAVPVSKQAADTAFRAASCIGCGACVAACPNASAMLFTGAKVTHLGVLPQGQPERASRVVAMVEEMDRQGFGGCTNIGECAAVCPAEIPLEVIALMNRDLLRALLRRR